MDGGQPQLRHAPTREFRGGGHGSADDRAVGSGEIHKLNRDFIVKPTTNSVDHLFDQNGHLD